MGEHAICIYLCEKHGWRDLWPEDLVERARVNQYLHFHHRNTRELVIGWSRRLWPSVFGIDDPDEAWLARNTFPGMVDNAAVCARTLDVIDGMLSRSRFIAGEQPTLADISAYEELGQNQPRYANCTDYSAHAGIRRWLRDMAQLPEHDLAHQVWTRIGDVNQVSGGMRTIALANKATAQAWSDAVAAMAGP